MEIPGAVQADLRGSISPGVISVPGSAAGRRLRRAIAIHANRPLTPR